MALGWKQVVRGAGFGNVVGMARVVGLAGGGAMTMVVGVVDKLGFAKGVDVVGSEWLRWWLCLE